MLFTAWSYFLVHVLYFILLVQYIVEKDLFNFVNYLFCSLCLFVICCVSVTLIFISRGTATVGQCNCTTKRFFSNPPLPDLVWHSRSINLYTNLCYWINSSVGLYHSTYTPTASAGHSAHERVLLQTQAYNSSWLFVLVLYLRIFRTCGVDFLELWTVLDYWGF